MREYWLPCAPLMFSHWGWAGSFGGLRGSNAMWHAPHAVPIRNGGSIEPSANRLSLLSLKRGSFDKRPTIAVPAREAAIDLEPPFLVETRIRELAEPEGAGRGAERQIAGGLALVLRSVVRVLAVDGSVAVVAGRVAIPFAADVAQQLVVAGAPIEPVGGLEALRRAAVAAGQATPRIVDDAPRRETVAAFPGIEHAVPVDQHVDALRKDVGVEARVAGGGLVPDLAAGALRGGERRFPGVEAGVVRHCRARCCRCRSAVAGAVVIAACANASDGCGAFIIVAPIMPPPINRRARTKADRCMAVSFAIDAGSPTMPMA